MKIKVLHLVHSFDVGGMENGIVNLINNCNSQLFEHAICAFSGQGKMLKRLQKQIHYYCLRVTQKDYFIIPKLIRLFKKIQPDILHIRSWGPYWDGLWAGKLARVPKIIFGFHGKDYNEFHLSKAKYIQRKLKHKFLSLFVNRITTLNKHMQESYAKEFAINPTQIVILPNGVDTERFKLKGKNNELRQKFGLQDNDFVIGTVGRLSKIKNVEAILQVSFLLKQKEPSLRLKCLIIGNGPERERLITYTQKMNLTDIVFFLGERNDVPLILQVLDVYVQSSLYEGFSNTILEAMATGLPVVVSDVGGNSELVINGKTGFLFSPKDIESFKNKIEIYISQPEMRRKHGLTAYKRAVKEFSLSQMVRRYEEFYMELMKTK